MLLITKTGGEKPYIDNQIDTYAYFSMVDES